MSKFNLELAKELLEKGKQFAPNQAKPHKLFFYGKIDGVTVPNSWPYLPENDKVLLNERCACILGQMYLGATNGEPDDTYDIVSELAFTYPNDLPVPDLLELSEMFESGNFSTKEEILITYEERINKNAKV